MTQIGTFEHDNLIAGDFSLVTEDVLVASGILARGAVLGRVKASVPTTGTIAGTGNGTCTVVTGGPDTKRGSYVATCIAVETHGGTFQVVNPDGDIIGTVKITAGAGGTGVFSNREITFTITDGSTDFILGDTATIAVSDGVPATVAVTGTGNGTLTAIEGRRGTKLGAYVIECTAAATHGGVFKIADPDGNDIQTGITISGGAGGTASFDNDQLAGIITDGSTDFIVGDYFTVTVTIDPRQVVLCDKTATDGSSKPYAVLAEDVDASAAAVRSTGYRTGQFNQREITLATGTDIEDVREEMEAQSMFLRPSVSV